MKRSFGRNWIVIFLCGICLSTFSQPQLKAKTSSTKVDTILVDYSTKEYDHFVRYNLSEIGLTKRTLAIPINLYDESNKNLVEISEDNILTESSFVFINFGNVVEEGTYQGFLDSAQTKEIVVIYSDISELSYFSSKPIIYKRSRLFEGFDSVVVPVIFNQSLNQITFDHFELPLYKKDSDEFIKYLKLDRKNTQDYLQVTGVKHLQAGYYSGKLKMKVDGNWYEQELEFWIKHHLAWGLFAFILFFGISYGVRYFSVREEKVIAYNKAKELKKAVESLDKSEGKRKLLKQIDIHIYEIEYLDESIKYYLDAYERLKKDYIALKAKNSSLESLEELKAFEENENKKFDKLEEKVSADKWTRLTLGINAVHVLLSLLFSLLTFQMIFVANDVFGSDLILDYLKLFAGVLTTVVLANGLIKERIKLFGSEVNK